MTSRHRVIAWCTFSSVRVSTSMYFSCISFIISYWRGSRIQAASLMQFFVALLNRWKPFSGVMVSSVLDVSESYIRLCLILSCRHLIFTMIIIRNFVLVMGWEDLFFIENIIKEKCVGSVKSFNAKSGHFTNFLHLCKFFSFCFLNIFLNVTVSAIKTCLSKRLKR